MSIKKLVIKDNQYDRCDECYNLKQYYEDKIKTLTEEFATLHEDKIKALTNDHIMAVFSGKKIK